ncbi:E3 ubiquitin-protein ligase AMFR-like [Mizuhopecten yessoensis]|uniref:E3 ubiquitin-protein ligase AMFR n=1 Tax=Mizuhopecten yessoensis TaxID=6573 RepID=A0A210PE59_MIZYE|nr:E3 ubiquitin-protein ligase AMFR-like [Mizuhopecten yessoensis]OWF34775.1 E3 ubiquitin-protein ligase AMFR [Mizuhopecten yessoensis]
MPVVYLERLPLPSLQTYSAISAILLSCSVFYAYQVVVSVEEISKSVTVDLPAPASIPRDVGSILNKREDASSIEPVEEFMNFTLPYDNLGWNIFHVLTTEGWCIWTLVNTAYCCLIFLGKVIQKQVFGDLRVSERQHLKDRIWNFLFYKFIFIFGVMNVQTMDEVVNWVAWFTILGFFHLLIQLSKDRFEYVSFSPTTPKWFHLKLISLLSVVLLCSATLLVICIYVGMYAGLTVLAFMAAECLILGFRTLYVILRYVIHLVDMNMEGVWENRTVYIYYAELVFELSVLSVDFAHHLHMLLWGNFFLSMASLVICMQLRYLFYEFQRRVRRHKNYRKVVKNMEARFSMATTDDLKDNNDNCAICWEPMETARKLPCDHLFHNGCLLSWLEQDTSCPTCRTTLNDSPEEPPREHVPDARGDAPINTPPPGQPINRALTNHFFHFDGSRYVSWFPSFSVEVTHTQLLPQGQQQPPIQTSQLDSMARQVETVFPHIPLNVIMDDLRQTRSVDFTIENILEGRVQAPLPGTLVTRAALGDAENPPSEDPSSQLALPTTMSRTSVMAIEAATAARHQEDQYSTPDPQNSYTSLDPQSSYSSPDPPISQSRPLYEYRRDEGPSPTGSRFSKSANEREVMLQDRKNSMLEQARRRYLATCNPKQYEDLSNSDSDESQEQFLLESSNSGHLDNRTRQRELAFKAAQRRMGLNDEAT